ncbi:MAG: alanine racemase [Moraxellaceae bacterium]|nr:alanine racemase [Moraxellaceae bacterium]
MRNAHLTINHQALLHNVAQIKRYAPQSKVMAMVKADAYGHGAVVVSNIIKNHVDALGVAFLAEAIALREAGIHCPIAILEGVFSTNELDLAFKHDCYLVVHQQAQVDFLSQYAGNKKTLIWLKVDSGMHRLGFTPQDITSAYTQLRALPCVHDIILTSHFACADDLGSPKTSQQLQVLDELTKQLPPLARSFANSAAILAWPQTHHQWVRAGIMLYGSSPFANKTAHDFNLQAVMTLKTQLIAIQHLKQGETVGYGSTWQAQRDTRLGVIAIGYGDGYPRHLLPNTPVLVNGQKTVIIGRVSMDMITVDLTDIEAQIGNEVTLWGEGLSADTIANSANTISYELFCQITQRVTRFIA